MTDPDDPDGFDEARRRDVFLRMVGIRAKHERDARVANMTPLQVAESDLASLEEFARQFEADETSIPVTAANRRSMAKLLEELRDRVDELR